MNSQLSTYFVPCFGGEPCQLTVYVQGESNETTNGIPLLLELSPEQAKADGEAELQLLEGIRYEYELSNTKLSLALDQDFYNKQNIVVQSRRSGQTHCGVLNPGLATGRLPLVVKNAVGAVHGRVDIEVRSRKLSYKSDYQQMLSDITERCVDLLLEMRSPSSFKAEPDPVKDPETIAQRFAFIRGLLQSEDFKNAIHRIIAHPHQIWESEQEHRATSRGFKPTAKLQRQLAQGNRRVALPESHPLHLTLKSLPERLNVHRATLTEDTTENQFVKFALRSFHRFLDDMRTHVDKQKDTRLHDEISSLCTWLENKLASDVMRFASEPSFLPLGSPTLQRREGYREVLQAWSHFAMAASLVWSGGDNVYGAGQRDVATLYEYWVFFALLKTVANVFKLDEPASSKLIDETTFGLKLKSGKYLALKGRSQQAGRNLEVRFSYNRSFKATTTARVAGSWTQTLRPDYTLSLWPVGFTEEEAELQELMVHIHFDAKYRLEQATEMLSDAQQVQNETDEELESSLSETKQDENRGTYKRADLMKMHAYRDAIRRTQGAYVIYPGEDGGTKRLEGFHEVLPGLGAFALRPGTGTESLSNFIIDVVRHVADRSSARERLSYYTFETYQDAQHKPPEAVEEQRIVYGGVSEKGLASAVASERSRPPRDISVLIGSVKDDEQLQWIRESGLYNFRAGYANGALKLDHNVVGAAYLLLYTVSDKSALGLFKIKAPLEGPVLCSATELTEKGYPSVPSQSSYLIFEIEKDHDFANYRWNIEALPNANQYIKNGMPFTTSLEDLLASAIYGVKFN